jgi:hypothetical protein
LFWAANRLVEQGEMDALDQLAEVAVGIGLTPREVQATVESALRTSGGAA